MRRVSRRFSGSFTQALTELSDSHNVLFDVRGDKLFVTSKRALSSISMPCQRRVLASQFNSLLTMIRFLETQLSYRMEKLISVGIQILSNGLSEVLVLANLSIA